MEASTNKSRAAVWTGEEGLGYQLRWPRSEYVVVNEPPLEGWVPGKPGPAVPGTPVVRGYGGRLRKGAPQWPAPWPVGGVFAPKWWPRERPRPAEFYNPVEVAADILLDAQRAAGDNPRVLLRFVNKWGGLGVGVPGDRHFLDGVAATGDCLTQLKEWLEAHQALRKGRRLVMKVPEWIKELPALTATEATRIKVTKRRPSPELIKRFPDLKGRTLTVSYPVGLKKTWPSQKSRHWTWRDLIFTLNEHLRDIHLAAVRERRTIVPVFRPRTLHGALWLEVWRQITGMNRHRRCPECRVLFIPGRANQQYCTRQCANRPTVRRWKREQKRKKNRAQQKEAANE